MVETPYLVSKLEKVNEQAVNLADYLKLGVQLSYYSAKDKMRKIITEKEDASEILENASEIGLLIPGGLPVAFVYVLYANGKNYVLKKKSLESKID